MDMAEQETWMVALRNRWVLMGSPRGRTNGENLYRAEGPPQPESDDFLSRARSSWQAGPRPQFTRLPTASTFKVAEGRLAFPEPEVWRSGRSLRSHHDD